MTQEEKEFFLLVRRCVQGIDRKSPTTIKDEIDEIRTALLARGHKADCFVGVKNLSKIDTAYWYAGQILNIYDTKSWFAMNSIINCLDKFCPQPTE